MRNTCEKCGRNLKDISLRNEIVKGIDKQKKILKEIMEKIKEKYEGH